MSQVDICQRLEDAWRPFYRRDTALERERLPDLRPLAEELAPDERSKLLVRLIEIDRWYREQLGCGVGRDHYLALFPDWPAAVQEAFENRHDTTDGESLAACEIPALRCPACARDSLRISSDNGSFVCHNQDCKGRFSLKPKADGIAPVLATVGHYEIVGLLGQGGFARVWLAKDPVEQRYVALKIPKRTLDRAVADRFIRETRCDYAMLCDPRAQKRIPQLINWGRDGDVDYIAFEFHNAVPLSDYLAQHETFSPRRAAKLCHQVALTLQIAHDNNIVHRDVKPSNILIQDDQPLLTDFGIAKVLGSSAPGETGQTQGFLGTLNYASPEHRTPEQIDARSDVFSLGIVLFQIITGQLPFDGADDWERFLKIADRCVAAPKLSKLRSGVDPLLDDICGRCLENDPHQRYQSAAELARDLERYLGQTNEQSPVSGKPASPQFTERVEPASPPRQLVVPAPSTATVPGTRRLSETTRSKSDIDTPSTATVPGTRRLSIAALLAVAMVLGLGLAGVLIALIMSAGGGSATKSGNDPNGANPHIARSAEQDVSAPLAGFSSEKGPKPGDDPKVNQLIAWLEQQLPLRGKSESKSAFELAIDYEHRHTLSHEDLQRAVPRIAALLEPFQSVKLYVKHPHQSIEDDYLKAMLRAVGPKAQSLILRLVSGYTQEGLAEIRTCPNLVALEFSGPNVHDLSFLHGKRLQNLRILSAPKLSDQHLHTLNTTEMTVLDTISCPGIRFLDPPRFHKLHTLILSYSGVEAPALKHIAKVTTLRTLVLGDGEYGVEDLRTLKDLKRLKKVILPKRFETLKAELYAMLESVEEWEFR
jgi:serine/threonine protein kinase